MSEAHTLLPEDTKDTDAVSQLVLLSSSDFAIIVPALLPWMLWSRDALSLIRQPLNEFLISRIIASPPSSSDPLISALISVLATAAPTADAANLQHPLLF
ncbi:hypothetical protein B0H19DRAFT_1277407 [Mycena capillaripes]|nr:hypothetical protein B0H19DRAFT_1277407 [Mycena capillaripes]